MNITVFDPTYIKAEHINDIIRAFHISEVYSFLPYDENTNNILKKCECNVSIRREYGETYDSVARRGVYKFVSLISTPIVVYGEWIGDCSVADLYKDSHWLNYWGNMKLDDPNILILSISQKYCEEERTINFFRYVFNILKKYGTIDYKNRICRVSLNRYITLSYKTDISIEERNVLFYRLHHRNSQSILELKDCLRYILEEYCQIYDSNELARYFLTEEGFKEREIVILEIIEEERERELEAAADEKYDYEEDTYYALGGNDYDAFKERGGSIDDMKDWLGL